MATRSSGDDGDDLDDRVRACARTGTCDAWRGTAKDDDAGFRERVREALRRAMTTFGDEAFGVERRGVGREGDDGEGKRATKRARTTTETETETEETEEIASAATVAAMRRAYEDDVEKICGECVSAFDRDAPFTIQRICELACEPSKYYSTPYKLASALFKLFAVTQTVDRARSSDREATTATNASESAAKTTTPAATEAMVRDARDPRAAEQKAFIGAAFRETTPVDFEESIHPPRPPSPPQLSV